MRHLNLTAKPQRELQTVSRHAVGRVALRAHMVLLSGRGGPGSPIALSHECGADVVRLWRHRSQRHGVAGRSDQPKSGRPPQERRAGPVLDAPASQSPRCCGHAPACWSVGRLTPFLAQRCPRRRSLRRVRRSRRRMGWRWARPRRAPATAHPPDPAPPVKRAAITAAWRQAPPGLAPLLVRDEADLPLLPVVRARWRQGRRGRVPPPGQHARHACCGALAAIGGPWPWADQERQLAVPFGACRDQVRAASPIGPLSLVLDNAPTPTATVVARGTAAPPRAPLLGRPTSSAPMANPAARIWGLLKSDVAADRREGKLATLLGHARRFCAELAPHPVKPPAAA